MIGNDSAVAAEWTVTATTSRGADYRNRYCVVFTVDEDSKITEIHEYLDNRYAERLLTG